MAFGKRANTPLLFDRRFQHEIGRGCVSCIRPLRLVPLLWSKRLSYVVNWDATVFVIRVDAFKSSLNRRDNVCLYDVMKTSSDSIDLGTRRNVEQE